MADLLMLASILRKNAAKIAERTSIKPNELAAAEDLGAKFSEAVGIREQSPQVIAQAARFRQAAYTLFVKAYEEVRAAVQYLRRHEGDADNIIPSLFANRGARRKPTADNADKPNVPVTPVVNPQVPATPGANGGSAAKITSSDHGPFVQ
jgi:hypothetical protein